MPVATLPCNLCGTGAVEVIGTTDRKHKPLRTVICRNCGLVWTDPRPGSRATREYYTEHYRLQYKASLQPKLKHVYRETQRAMQRLRRIEPLLIPGMRLLDIGAGAGFFPYTVQQRGYAIEGIEPNQGYAAYATDELHLELKVGLLQDFDFPAASFDIITLNHVLEHLEDPGAALQCLLRWNKPGGYLNIEVPNIEATYHAPGHKFHLAHLYPFNPDNLALLGRKAGYRIHDLHLMPGTLHINIMLQKPAAPPAPPETCDIPGNYDRIRGIFDRHTALRHYLSPRVYARFIRKILGYLKERYMVGKFHRGREIVDYLLPGSNG